MQGRNRGIHNRTLQERSFMRIFLSGYIWGGRQMLPVYRHIYDFPESAGCDVVSWHAVDLGSEEIGRDERAGDIPA